jgi:hypothetical protein
LVENSDFIDLAEGLLLRGARDGICKAFYQSIQSLEESREPKYIPKHIQNMMGKICIAVRAQERYTVGKGGSRQRRPAMQFDSKAQ